MNYIWALCEWKGMNEKKATAIMHIGQYFYNWEKERNKERNKEKRKKEKSKDRKNETKQRERKKESK